MASTEIADITESTLVSLVWEVEGYDMAGRIAWRTGDTYRSSGVSASELSGIAATGVIDFPNVSGNMIRSHLISTDHDKLVRVLELLQQMTAESKEIGVPSFRMMWVFA